MSNENKTSETPEKPVTVTVSKAVDFKNRKLATGNSLTLRQYRELRNQDQTLLTKTQCKQIEEANEQLRRVAEHLTRQIDFTGISKVLLANQPAFTTAITQASRLAQLNLVPAVSALAQTQATLLPTIKALQSSTLFAQNQFTALAAIQKSLATFPTQSILPSVKGIQDAFQAPLIARTLLADFQTRHERIFRELRFDIGTLSASVAFSRFETVNFDVHDVQTDDDSLTATATATQSSSVADVTFTDRAMMRMVFDELHATRQEVADLSRQLLAKDNEKGQQLIAPSSVSYQRATSSLQLGSFKVAVSISSKQAQFARTLVGTPSNIIKKWDIDDLIYEAFGERIDNEQNWIIKIRSYIHQLNQKVLIASGGTVHNFFVLDGIEVYVNPEHINPNL